MSNTNVRSIFVETREWYDKTGGQVYFSSRIYVNGKHVYTTGMTYGYGSHDEYVAAKVLAYRGIIPDTLDGRSIRWARDLGIDVYTVKYESKKRDLWKEEDSTEEWAE
jgi:hypothetical protein